MAGRLPTKQAQHKIGQYGLVSKFLGYRAREDNTILPIGTMVSPSQNVVIQTSGRLTSVAGYVLDGAGSTVIDSGILSNCDFYNFKGDVRNLRCGFLTSAGNDGKLQYRYVDSTNTVNWVTLKSSLTNVRLAFTPDWFDTTNLVKDVLWVDGSNNIFSWNGAVTTFASGTTNKTISLVGNSASLTSYSNMTGTTSFITANNSAVGMALLAYISLTVQPTNNQTLILSINGTSITITFVTVIGSNPGNVLIGANLGATMSNLLGLLQSPGSTTGNQVALSSPNQTLVGYITFASHNNTVTNQGSLTWAEQGFSGTGSVVINGVSSTYAGGNYSNTLYGISNDVSSSTIGAIIHQDVVTITLSSMTAILATFAPTVIGVGLNNQLYLGSSTSNQLYISKTNTYTDYTITSPVRVAGDGCLLTLPNPAVAFIAQENRTDNVNTFDMYVSSGDSMWSVIEFIETITSDSTGNQTAAETVKNIPLKFAKLQGALSQRMVTKMKNHIVFIGNDNVANFLGYTSFQFVPETVDFSYEIIDDMNTYNFTDGSSYYYKNYIYVMIPKEGLIRIYNMSDQTKQVTQRILAVEDVDPTQPWFWEAPVLYPISGMYWTPDKGLCGHNYTTSESYQLFTGGSFNGQNITTNATFGYEDKGDRTQKKASDEIWVEGYIQQNTILNNTVAGDLDAFMTSQTFGINGDDNTIVAYGSGGNALGKNHLGSKPLGGTDISSILPAWFHVVKTYPQVPSYLEQISFGSEGIDLSWELITFGTNAMPTVEGNNDITQ